MTEITPQPSRTVAPPDVSHDLQRFENAILDQLEAVGLPTDGVVVDLEERRQLLSALENALRALPTADRGRALYISKMIIVGAVGAFDAALNFLWDETISELRRRVVRYDLTYFYDVAVKPDLRKHFSTQEDLQRVQDADLLEACRGIGLLSDHGYKQLDLIRYMRNHASASHPNDVELTGLQLASYLQTCIMQVITLPEDQITTDTGRLLRNIKDERLQSADGLSTSRRHPAGQESRAAAVVLVQLKPGHGAW